MVAAGIAERCTVQLAYAIGEAEPVSVAVDFQGTGVREEEAVARALAEPGAGPLWFQLYPQARREDTLALVRRAALGEAELLAGPQLPLQISRPSGFVDPPVGAGGAGRPGGG